MMLQIEIIDNTVCVMSLLVGLGFGALAAPAVKNLANRLIQKIG